MLGNLHLGSGFEHEDGQIKYRPEVDGLRTIAVFSVIFYHAKFSVAGWELFPGGYLGVDIFFVISGYLITTLLMTELAQTERISITHFYERRARRLLPGLLIVMLVSLPFAWRYLLPDQLVDFSKSLVFSLGFASNFYWNYSLQQYGAESALLQPFLHTWSLAVEEQYYIVFPLFLFAVYKWGREYLAGILLFVMVLSLLLAEWMTGWDASFSFYMMPTRFWELLAGSLVALAVLNREAPKPALRWSHALSLLGLLMILGSLLYLDFGTHHPGFITLVPVLGTVLVILFSENKGWVTRALSTRPMVYLGLLSYSLYLWHYPIFAFGRMENLQPSLTTKCVWIGLTLLLSALSYHLVEKPLRSRRFSGKELAVILLLLSTLVISICLYWIKGEGIPSRGDYLLDLLQANQRIVVSQNGTDCLSGAPGSTVFPPSDSCFFQNFPGSPTLVLVGDSHAAAIAESVRVLASENQLNFVQITQVICPHLGRRLEAICPERNEAVRSILSQLEDPAIIYSSRIPLYISGLDYGESNDGQAPKHWFLQRGNNSQIANDVVSSLTEWSDDGYGLVIIYPVPEQGFDVDKTLKLYAPPISNADQLPTLTTSYTEFKERVASSYAALDKVTGFGVLRVYPEKLFCREKNDTCIASESDRLYFEFDNHVSPLGADLIVREIAVVLDLKVPESFVK
jgi:peptidoglycan/LPS O-acetylase OafA/YrhL